MAEIYNLTMGAVVAKSGDNTLSASCSPGQGNFSVQSLRRGNQEHPAVQNRGRHYESVPGAETPVPFSIEMYHDGPITSDEVETVPDAILGTGMFLDMVAADPGGQYGINFVLTTTRDGVACTLTLTNCEVEFSYGEDGAANKISISGEARGTGSGDAAVWS